MTLAGDVATADGASAQLRMKGPMDDSVAIDRASDVSSAVASSATPPQAKVGAAQTTIYGLGAIVDATTSVFLNTYLYFYLTAVCGMEGWMAGLALALPLALDAMVDPLVGSLSDNLQSRFGRRRPFMLAAILPIGVSLGLLFSVPVGLTGWGLFAYVIGLALALRVGLSLFNLPYAALGAELTSDYVARSTLASARFAISTAGNLVGLTLGYGVFLSAKAGGQLHRAGYTPLAWSGAALIMGMGLVSALGTRMKGLPAPPPGSGWSRESLLREFREVLRNQTFLILSLTLVVFMAAEGAALALTLHVSTFFWRLTPGEILITAIAPIPAAQVGAALTASLNRRLEKRTIAQIGLGLLFVSQCAPVVLVLSGALPAKAILPVLIVAAFLLGAAATMIIVGVSSMMADATDEHELLYGGRREALFFAGTSFAGKASNGLGLLLAGLITYGVRFPSHPGAPGSPGAPSWASVRDLALITGPGVALSLAIPFLMLLGYRINRARHAEILRTLAVRKAAAPSA